MSEGKVTKATLEAASKSGQRLVYNKTTGQFEVLKSYEILDPTRQTEMKPSNIPNAIVLQEIG